MFLQCDKATKILSSSTNLTILWKHLGGGGGCQMNENKSDPTKLQHDATYVQNYILMNQNNMSNRHVLITGCRIVRLLLRPTYKIHICLLFGFCNKCISQPIYIYIFLYFLQKFQDG